MAERTIEEKLRAVADHDAARATLIKNWFIEDEPAETLSSLCTRAADHIAILSRWKEEALEVERSWDVQAIGKLLPEVTWGDDIRAAIQPAIERLLRENAELKARLPATDLEKE